MPHASIQRCRTTPLPDRPRRASVAMCVLLVSLMLIHGVGCGGGGGGGGSSAPASGGMAPPAQVNGSPDTALTASQPGELLAYFQNNLRLQAEKKAVEVPTGTAQLATTPAFATAVSSASSAELSMSGTTLQEAGVDEDDWLKTDGNMIYALSRNSSGAERLLAHRRAADGSVTLAAQLTFGNSADIALAGMHYAAAAQRIAVLGDTAKNYLTRMAVPAATPAPSASLAATSLAPEAGYKPQISLRVVNTTDVGTLRLNADITLDGSLVGSRLIGSTLYLVSRHAPALPVQVLGTASSAVSREVAIADVTLREILPTLTMNGVTEPLVKDTDCYVQRKNAALDLQITSITAIDLASPNLFRQSRCFAGGSEAVYVSASSIYLATSRYLPVTEVANGVTSLIFETNTSTDIHKFAISGQTISYRGSGNVPGHLGWDHSKKPYRLGEFNGDLRVLSFTGDRGWTGDSVPVGSDAAKPVASPARLSVLREAASGLAVVASLPNAQRPAPIGLPGEQVYAVRFLGARAYVVTFRRTDPLYVLDLANPLDPRLAGELKTPGFSDYLIPLGDSLLLGVGKDATDNGLLQGVKVALIDVSNPALPQQLAQRLIGKRGSTSALDYSPHGIGVLLTAGRARIALPVRVNDKTDYQPGYQALLRYEVDLASKQLTDKPLVQSADFASLGVGAAYSTFVMTRERSVQVGDFYYYLTGGALLAGAW